MTVRAAMRQVVLDALDARALAEFYRQVLGYTYRQGDEPPPPGEPDPAATDWLVLVGPDGWRIAFQPTDYVPPTTWPERGIAQQLHLDLTVPDVASLEAEHRRMLALGAQVRMDDHDSPDEPIYVYADPAGHPFCIFVAPPDGP